MGRTFHNLHVFADSARTRASVIKAVLAHAKADGYQRVARVTSADRVIRIGGAAPWLTIEDDGYGIPGIAKAVAKTRAPILEAYCEASAIVWLELYANTRRAGGWGGSAKRPPAKLVEPLLAKGNASDLAKAWDEGQRQVFPETALAVAAQHFGIKVDRMFGDTILRGTTIALRRKRAAWLPQYQVGTPKFEVGWGSNQCWGQRHLIFEEQLVDHRVHVRSVGGPGRGVSIRLAGSAIDERRIEIVSVEHEGLELVRDGTTHTWRDPDAKVPAGLVESPDIFSMSRREIDRAHDIVSKSEWYIDVKYRGLKEGACELGALVESGKGRGKGSLDLQVLWRPWQPATARDTDPHRLFDMHRCEHVQAHITLRGTLAEAWQWARPHVEAWCAAENDKLLGVMRGDDEVLFRENRYEQPVLSYAKIAELVPSSREVPFIASGEHFLFGTFRFKPWRMNPSDQFVVQLVLGGKSPDEDNAAQFARLTAICDEAMANGLAYSALVASHHYAPSEKTAWEEITYTDDHPLKMVSWHERHIRGIDKRMWLSAEHAALVDLTELAKHATVTDVGSGVRITVPDDRPRRTLAPLEELLRDLLPHELTIDTWKRDAEQASKAQQGQAAG